MMSGAERDDGIPESPCALLPLVSAPVASDSSEIRGLLPHFIHREAW